MRFANNRHKRTISTIVLLLLKQNFHTPKYFSFQLLPQAYLESFSHDRSRSHFWRMCLMRCLEKIFVFVDEWEENFWLAFVNMLLSVLTKCWFSCIFKSETRERERLAKWYSRIFFFVENIFFYSVQRNIQMFIKLHKLGRGWHFFSGKSSMSLLNRLERWLRTFARSSCVTDSLLESSVWLQNSRDASLWKSETCSGFFWSMVSAKFVRRNIRALIEFVRVISS